LDGERSDVHLLVSQHSTIHLKALTHKKPGRCQLTALVELWVAAAVEAHHRHDPAAVEIESEEGALLQAASDDDAVPASRMTHVLDRMLVLVGPERVDVGENLAGAEHAARRCPTLAFGIVVVLDAQATEDRVHLVRDITSGVDISHACPAVLVHEHAVAGGDAAILQRVE